MAKRVLLARPVRSAPPITSRSRGGNDKKPGAGGTGVYPPIGGDIYTRPTPRQNEDKKQSSGVDDLLASALALSSSDRKLLLARLALSQQAEKPGDRDLEMWAVGVQRALGEASGSGPGPAGSLVVLKRSLAPEANWGPVAAFMASAGFSELDVVRRQAVYSMLADLLVRYALAVARKVGAPLTPKFVANNAGHLAAIFDNAFPGYIAAGLAPLVALRLAQGRT